MRDNKIGRRRFLQSTATAAVGISAGIAASGTAAANDSEDVEVFVYTDGEKSWDYDIYTTFGNDPVEKGVLAEGDDDIASNGEYVQGHIDGYESDNYWIDADDTVDRIYIEYEDYGYIQFETASTSSSYGTSVGIQRDRNSNWPGYDYSITFENPVRLHPEYGDEGQDEVLNYPDEPIGNPAVGTIDPKDTDGYINAAPRDITVEDPGNSGSKIEISIRR